MLLPLNKLLDQNDFQDWQGEWRNLYTRPFRVLGDVYKRTRTHRGNQAYTRCMIDCTRKN